MSKIAIYEGYTMPKSRKKSTKSRKPGAVRARAKFAKAAKSCSREVKAHPGRKFSNCIKDYFRKH